MSRTDETARARLAVALDLPDRAQLLAMARRVAPAAGLMKLGLEAFMAEGPSLVREVARAEVGVFLDLKFHDIPNTVGRAAAAAARTGAAIVNCHAAGGAEMMKAFGEEGRAAAAKAGLSAPRFIAVTILTSLDAASVHAVGLTGSPREAALRLAALAQGAGLDGVVCSPDEIEAIRAACGKDFFLVVPGVRPAGAARGDQKRVATPAEAIERGADVLVIGRPITGAPDPATAARAILTEIAAAIAKPP
jgi:orotidine-5'-phosphate decarboxylase